MSYHRPWADWTIQPRVPATGAWDGPDWRKPGRKLLNYWENNQDQPQGPQGPPKGPTEKRDPKGGKGGDKREKRKRK